MSLDSFSRPEMPPASERVSLPQQGGFDQLEKLAQQILFSKRYFVHVAVLVWLADALLTFLIIHYVSYTEIDWVTYCQQARLFLTGERDYAKIQGDTGPLVYPAGHLYFYSLLNGLTADGANIRAAQYAFAAIYLATQAVVFAIYRLCPGFPPVALLALVVSKRLHSIYVLRLFNDCVAMLVFYIALLALCYKRWNVGALFFSLALSVKMNILYFLPAFGFVLLLNTGLITTAASVIFVVLIQVWVGLPFMSSNLGSYLARSFDFSRTFLYKWTVNWRFVPEEVFQSRPFASALLASHFVVLLLFAWFRWGPQEGGLVAVVQRALQRPARPAKLSREISVEFILDVFFTCNLVGVIFARSLHYQFYSWYAHQLVYLVIRTPFSLPMKIFLLFGIEYSWNVFPSTDASSAALLACNALILLGQMLRTEKKGEGAEKVKES